MTLHFRRFLCTGIAAGLLAFGAAIPRAAAQENSAAAPKMQLPADQRAYNAAMATSDPEQRLAAQRKLVKDYPKSKYAARTQDKILETLEKNFPDRAAEIDAQAKLVIKKSGKGNSKWYQE